MNFLFIRDRDRETHYSNKKQLVEQASATNVFFIFTSYFIPVGNCKISFRQGFLCFGA